MGSSVLAVDDDFSSHFSSLIESLEINYAETGRSLSPNDYQFFRSMSINARFEVWTNIKK
jgi:hypothetical protein